MENIQKLRGKMGLSQEELAQKMGLCRGSIVKLESKKCKSTSAKTEKNLCDFFGVTPCQLYGVDNLRHSPSTKEELAELISLLQEKLEKWD